MDINNLMIPSVHLEGRPKYSFDNHNWMAYINVILYEAHYGMEMTKVNNILSHFLFVNISH